MIANLFRPKEVRATLQALEDLAPSFASSAPCAHGAMKLVFGEARQLIAQQARDTVASIRDENWAPRDLALLLISKRAFAHATSGAHHAYRGTPNQTGRAIAAIYTTAGKLMVESACIELSEQHSDQVALVKAMKEVG